MKTLTNETLAELSAKAAAAPRLRAHHNLHEQLEDDIQRLAIAMEPDTYVRPHRHANSPELLIMLAGALDWIEFDAAGETVVARHRLGEGGARVFEMPAGAWHSVISLEPGSVVFEIKRGPYLPQSAAEMAAWAPAEGEARVADMLAFLRRCQPGDRFA
ncbi:WbuC family cupin fold metalloprotein [Chromobacterium alticapitis]|uniref:Cupin fold metalloprotein, WbuC family n=1 Tax=Chromobacterium alticapitis TaxID=2073169 RepID=A0A2S5DJF4_9NEIS|nr:WbuC family cupin fold metalloprotein [Chromobacterium alticapitis]POZ63206.1 cupin fold metalloprotein, WbuC family [Chromobacterium alticapitis]